MSKWTEKRFEWYWLLDDFGFGISVGKRSRGLYWRYYFSIDIAFGSFIVYFGKNK